MKAALNHLADATNPRKHSVVSGSQVSLLVNNLGGCSKLEELILARDATKALSERGLVVVRVYVERFLTSLETAGFQLSILEVNEDTLQLLDADTKAGAWPKSQSAG